MVIPGQIDEGGAPQSNQRGIETLPGAGDPVPAVAGLNRTSVGLKLERTHRLHVDAPEPQSNQRGIETGFPGPGWARISRASIEPAWD